MVKITYDNSSVEMPENTVENQNVISENRSGENPQEISEVKLLPMLNEGKAEEETSNDPRPNSPSDSEESTYYSGPESTEEDDASENRSGEIPEVEGKTEKKSSDDLRSDVPPSLDETLYLSHSKAKSPSASDQSHYHLPTNQQKQIFFEILKDLLKNPLEQWSPTPGLQPGSGPQSRHDWAADTDLLPPLRAPPRKNTARMGTSILRPCKHTTHMRTSVPRPHAGAPHHSELPHTPAGTPHPCKYATPPPRACNTPSNRSAVGKRLGTTALEYGNTGVRQSGENILELIYMNEKCELRILNSDRICQWKQKLKTADIYLKWRGNHVEHLNPENIQNVQNELESLGIQNNRIQSCFSLARTKFMEEPSFIQNNMKLDIICDKVIIAFSEGKGENAAKVLYDDNLRSPRYFMKAKDWWVAIKRYFFYRLPETEHLLTSIGKMLLQQLINNFKLIL